jgi:hypothetical protein
MLDPIPSLIHGLISLLYCTDYQNQSHRRQNRPRSGNQWLWNPGKQEIVCVSNSIDEITWLGPQGLKLSGFHWHWHWHSHWQSLSFYSVSRLLSQATCERSRTTVVASAHNLALLLPLSRIYLILSYYELPWGSEMILFLLDRYVWLISFQNSVIGAFHNLSQVRAGRCFGKMRPAPSRRRALIERRRPNYRTAIPQ